MKRTFLARRNRLLSRTGPQLGLVALAVVAVVVLVRIVLPSAFLSASAPFLRASDAVGDWSNTLFAGFDSAAKLAAERDTLAQDNATLTEENATLTAKIADLDRLLGTEAPTESGVVAGVLARPPETAYDTLVVAAGSSAGVGQGDVAYTAGGAVLGVVSGVSSAAARVTLLSAPTIATDAWVGPARLPVTLLGEGGGAFIAKAPRSATTTAGDAVYVAGPGAVAIGRVATTSGDSSAPFITLDIAGIANIYSITQVVIRHTGESAWPANAPLSTTTPL